MSSSRQRSQLGMLAAALVFGILLVGAVLIGATDVAIARDARTLSWKIAYAAVPVDDKADLTELHRNASASTRERCIACHGDKKSSGLVLHRIHLRSPLLPDVACHECHRRVAITKRGNRTVVSWVDVGFCKKCHSEFPGLKPGSKMKPADFDADCTRSKCHVGKLAPKHDKPYLAKDMPKSECKGCHGGRVLPWTPRHEKADWIKTHGDEALRAGSDNCFQCHDFGLKFCDDCHKTKPPSHQPPEKWRTIHAEAARSDTRVCYSCHPTSFCKKCHLNHEAGWIDNHPAFVHKNGRLSCKECHSDSACGFCHTRVLTESVQTTSAP